MGTAKRERQKANRQQRLEELARSSRREKTRRRGLTITVVVVGGLLLLFGLARVFGGDDEATTPTITLAPGSSVDTASTTPTGSTEPPTTDPSSTDPASSTTEAPSTTAAPSTTVAFAYGTAPCPAEDGSTALPDSFEGAPELCIDPAASYTAEVTTNFGSFTIELDPASAPGNVNNFVTLARYGYYAGTECHRVLADFVVQCGRPTGDPATAEEAPGYSVGDELPAEGEYAEGVVAIANTGQPDTGGGQFFIITGPEGASLPPQYTIIGRVTRGYDSTVRVLEGLADPLAANGVPPLEPIEIESVTITES